MFMDEFGRIRIFHGVNCVNKEYPWYPEYMLNETRLDDLEKSGMNVVRLGTMWSGVEPIEGVYNDTYIDILRNIVIVRKLLLVIDFCFV
jgi:endoglycosylceramidase